MKQTIIKTLSSNPFLALGDRFFSHCVPVFMLHRFACPSLGVCGHEVALVRFALEYLRKRRFNIIPIEEIITALREGDELPPRTIALTIDDGYWDHVEVGGRLFSHYDCPVTYFVASGFVNGDLWFWDAKVEFVIKTCDQIHVGKLGELFPNLKLGGLSRSLLAKAIIFELANFPAEIMEEKIAQVSKLLDVELPEQAPDSYSATNWDRLRDLERLGMKIAPHSFSHPILSRETDKTVKWEMEKSWNDLRREIDEPSAVFCYPVGRNVDFGARETQQAKQLGFTGAVSAIPGPINTREPGNLYSLPRFGFPDNKADFLQYATWIESFKNKVRTRLH